MMRARLCATIAAPTTAELRRRRDAVRGVDLVELRLDSVGDPSVAGALGGRQTPVIVTCRPVWEGGSFKGSEEDRQSILTEALDLGAEYVDIEAAAGFDALIRSRRGRRIVLSFHDFQGVPSDLAARVAAMRATGAEVVKVAVTPAKLSDALVFRRLGVWRPGSFVFVAMGAAGLATRVLASRIGSAWTYAGDGIAPGQPPLDRMVTEYRFSSITQTTALYGIVGAPIRHTLSPAMHNAAFRAIGLDAVYLPLPAGDVDDFQTFAHAFDLRGASVTTPFKIDMFRRLDEVDAVARRVGAVNTIRLAHGHWSGTNTDVAGFLAPLAGYPLAGARAAVLGAGGAARAVVVALASAGARVSVHARRADRAAEIARLGGEPRPIPPAPGSWDILVNATPAGMFPRVDDTPLDHAVFDGRLVYDLVYNPPVTRLLREASAAGCDTIGGLEMLVAQAEEQSFWWTGRRPPASLLRQAALDGLHDRTKEPA